MGKRITRLNASNNAPQTNRTSKSKSQKKKESNRLRNKVLNAFEIAERAEERSARNAREHDNESDDNDSDDDSTYIRVGPDGTILGRGMNAGDSEEEEEDEDEDIDSDEAMGSDDDYDAMDSKFSQTARDGNLNEGYDSIDENELVSLSQAWDMSDSESKAVPSNELVLNDNDVESQSEESEGSSESEDGSDYNFDEEEEELPEGETDESEPEDSEPNDALYSSISKYAATSSKKNEVARKKLQNYQVTENADALPGKSKKLTLADMMESVPSNKIKDGLSLLKNKRGVIATQQVAVPLPKRIQDRFDRKAALEITTEDINKWQDVVTENRNAEVLSFPINPETAHEPKTSFTPNAPTTDLEKKVNSLLKASLLTDDRKEAQFEDLAVNKLSKEEMIKQTQKLRQMRELMFREERRAKRIKKIKSKTYRKIHKNERTRNQQLVEGDLVDVDENDSARATERMTLRHKNTKWAKNLVNSGLSKDKSNRSELEEMHRHSEDLRRKHINNDDESDSEEEVADLESDAEENEEIEKLKEKTGKGVLSMKFMKTAEEAKRAQNKAEMKELKRLELDEDDSEDEINKNTSVLEVKNAGRRTYAPGMRRGNKEVTDIEMAASDEREEDDSKSLSSKITKKFSNEKDREADSQKVTGSEIKKSDSNQSKDNDTEEEENPWNIEDDEDKPLKKKSKIHSIDKDSSSNSKRLAKLKNALSEAGKTSESTTDKSIINLNQSIKIIDPYANNNSDVEEEDDENEMVNLKNIKSFKNHEILKRAFAGDDIVEDEFEMEKKQIIEEEGDQEIDVTLPGWGSWTGGGIKPSKKRFIKKIKGIDANKRKDAKKKNVIINEKANKKNAKYTASSVPFPYKTREQYELSLQMPIGQEWVSRESHQRLTMPEVTVKAGRVIDPLKASFKK